jgi:hypothetical protein
MTSFFPSERLTFVHGSLQSGGTGALARSILLKRSLDETKNPYLTRQQLDTRERHLAELRQLIYRQLKLLEKDKLKSRDAERVQNLLVMLNDLMADYQTLRRTSAAVEQDWWRRVGE